MILQWHQTKCEAGQDCGASVGISRVMVNVSINPQSLKTCAATVLYAKIKPFQGVIEPKLYVPDHIQKAHPRPSDQPSNDSYCLTLYHLSCRAQTVYPQSKFMS